MDFTGIRRSRRGGGELRRAGAPPAAPPGALPAALLAALVLLPSCTAVGPTCPAYGVGAVTGHVREAGAGIPARVSARAVDGPPALRTVAETRADSTGWYRLELPTGSYRLEVAPPSGPGLFLSGREDTITVGQRVHRRDLERGRLLVRIAMPEALEGWRATLRLDGAAFLALADTVTGGRLDFDVHLLPPGRYLADLSCGNGPRRVTLSPEASPAGDDSLTVHPDEGARLTADLAGSYASLSGSVTGSWQQAGGPRPRAVAIGEDRRAVSSADCGDDGAFALHMLELEPVRLRIDIGLVERWIGGDAFETARVFDLGPGDEVGPVAVVESGIEVVLRGPGDLLYHDADVTVRSETGAEIVVRGHGSFDPIPVCNLPPGRHYLHVDGGCRGQAWAPRWYGGDGSPAQAAPIELAPGELRTVVVDLFEGGRIAGRVLTADGELAGSVRLTLHLAEDVEFCAYPVYTENGRFDFGGLLDGRYYLAVAGGHQCTWWYPGTWLFAEAVPIEIADLGSVTGLVWRLPAPDEGARP